jgi:signal transduction histidine kinase
MLPVAVARRFRDIEVTPTAAYYLNFEPVSTFRTVSAANLGTDEALAQMAGRVVVLGYTIPVAWPYTTYEQLNANSPLHYDSSTYLHGESLTVITTNAIENLLHGRTLAPAGWPARISYILAISGLTFWLWRRGAIFGSLWVTLGLWLVLALQSVLMARAGVYLPFSEAALFAGLGSMLGAWQALQVGLRRYADERSFNARNRDIARVRSEFLERFAGELSRINQHIAASAEQLAIPADAAPVFATARRHLRGCTEEFADYIAGVVQVSRLSVADRHPEMRPFDLSRLLHSVAERFQAMAAEKDMELRVDVAAGVTVRSNENIVDKIVFNFLSNAVKYSPSKTAIKIRVAASAKHLRVHVADDGPGIDEAHQSLIFEKFYRVRNDDTYRIKGSGLGLYLCRYFAGLIGARIELESKLGVGSDFALVLPL